MAKLSQHQQDETYYTRTYEGGIVTRQIHPDGVAYLKHCGVWVGDEIPSECMSVLREYGWLFTKDEVPFWGEVDWAPRWSSVRPRSLDDLVPYQAATSFVGSDGAGVMGPSRSAADELEGRVREMQARIERKREEVRASIRTEAEGKLPTANENYDRVAENGDEAVDWRVERDRRRQRAEREWRRLDARREAKKREEAEREAGREQREIERARNKMLQDARKRKRQEAARKGAETGRRDAGLQEQPRPVTTPPRGPGSVPASPAQAAVGQVIASSVALPSDGAQPQGRSLEMDQAFQRPSAAKWTPTPSYAAPVPAARAEPEWYSPEGRWPVLAWAGLLGAVGFAMVNAGWFVTMLLVAVLVYKTLGLMRLVMPILRADPSHLFPWIGHARARRDDPGYQRDRQLVALLVLILAAATLVLLILSEVQIEWLNAVALASGFWAICEAWRLRGV